MTATVNRAAFRALLHQHGISMKQAAALIADFTARPCGYRTVKAWLADPARSAYARPCPTWALDAFRAIVSTRVGG
ncbi:hypothetical protein [Thauera terpenica]|uniref:hypothetical protein n=1 Tax=Thauera terpenica TaxID=76113 RepID=UPI000B496AD7|nr:hypothetical protein [Thauera terpenica]